MEIKNKWLKEYMGKKVVDFIFNHGAFMIVFEDLTFIEFDEKPVSDGKLKER